MTLKKVTDRQAVLDALKDCDELGATAFLEKYGYGEAKNYVLVEDGKHYDSKAIFGAAYMIQHGRQLAFDDFKGGLVQVVIPLRKLGFEILAKEDLPEASPNREPKTFIVLWNPDGWEWRPETRSRNQQEIRNTGIFMGNWAMGNRRDVVQKDDRFFLLKVGDLPRGVMAAGHALGPMRKMPHWSPEKAGKLISYADIGWQVLLDEKSLLPKEAIEKEIPSKNWTIQSNGTELAAHHARELEKLWTKHLNAVKSMPGAVISAVGTGVDLGTEIERGYTTATVKRRKHQQKFRLLLLNATNDPKCLVCGFDQVDLLEAAHIIPDSQGGPSNLKNGRLLCLNHHKAHDLGLFRLENDEDVWHPDSHPFGPPEDWGF